MTTDRFEDGAPLGVLDLHIEAFLGHLRTAGYAERTLRKKRSIVAAFARWARREQIALDHLGDSDIAAFVKRSSGTRTARVQFELAALRPLLEYLRAETWAPLPVPVDASLGDALAKRYLDYLRQDRGLAENSVRVYLPFIRDFLTSQLAASGCWSPGAFDAPTIRSYLLARSIGRSGEYVRLLATALRSFFHFLFVRGDTPRDLCVSVPPVRKWRQSSVPAFLSPEEEERVLASTDRSTSRGRRDHAILLLLARLGLRAGEIVALELGDIRWRSGEIVVHGKGRMVEHVPLLSDIGEALALYLHEDRGASTSRRVFVRMLAPRVGLAGPCAIGHIVRLAFARAGLRPSSRGAAHRFRHSLATTMIRHGASMAEIAEVLRHRSQNTTAIYAKVSFEALRGVARSWPETGGAR
ncbi:MAG: tyrosine-type recombinase/integrase [Hyphomicrobiales bacterium]|nr:tyrosine-type recombinase/integrase [Hyphomicrobiales bacterium]